MAIPMQASLFDKISFMYKPVEVSPDPAFREQITTTDLDKLLNSNGTKTNKSSSFHKIYLRLLFQRMSLWPELKVVKATISIYQQFQRILQRLGASPSGVARQVIILLSFARPWTTIFCSKEQFSI